MSFVVLAGSRGASEADSPPEEYGLANAIAGVPFDIDTPTEPTITSEATVTTATFDANRVAGRRLICQAGSYGSRNLNAADQEIILQSGASFGRINIGASRIKVRGETARVGTIRSFRVDGAAADIFIYQVTVFNTGATGDDQNEWYGDRIAVLSSDISVGIYAAYADTGSHFIWANNDTEITDGSQSGLRLMSMNNTVVVDNRVYNPTHHTYRLHADDADSDNHYCSRNQFEGAGWQIQADSNLDASYQRLISAVVTSNRMYATASPGIYTGTGGAKIEDLTLTGNEMYDNIGGFWPSAELPAWTVSGNAHAAYTTPPAWSFL